MTISDMATQEDIERVVQTCTDFIVTISAQRGRTVDAVHVRPYVRGTLLCLAEESERAACYEVLDDLIWYLANRRTE